MGEWGEAWWEKGDGLGGRGGRKEGEKGKEEKGLLVGGEGKGRKEKQTNPIMIILPLQILFKLFRVNHMPFTYIVNRINLSFLCQLSQVKEREEEKKERTLVSKATSDQSTS